MNKLSKDFRFWCLALALLAILLSFIYGKQNQQTSVFNMIAIVDITRSMNVEDYQIEGKPVSRLTYTKDTLRNLLLKLPCESKLGLGVFTDRRSTLLFEPIEICSGFNELDAAISNLDWRMAWAADSRIANGLLSTLEMLKGKDDNILFLTDGQEAPPINPAYRASFAEVKGKFKGIIIGVGGLQAMPIPKFNTKGEQEGFYKPEDVPHRSSFGVSDLNPEKIEGYDARNAPFGSAEVIGSEHLSVLNEGYLQQLANEAGLSYKRLTDLNTFPDLVTRDLKPTLIYTLVDVRWWFATVVLILLSIAWV